MTARIVLLNGAGSSGKTSIARAIQAQAKGAFLHVQMDTFLDMMPAASLGRADGLRFEAIERNGKREVVVHSGPAVERTLRGMRHAIAAMARQGCNVVIDEVILDASLAEYRSLLADLDFSIVGVRATLEVLEQRELARGDREIGLARAQFAVVHRGVSYDLEVDTSAATPEECARLIVKCFGL